MKKALLGVAVAAAATAGYFYYENNASPITTDPVLSYVPADTLMFSGSLEDFPSQAYIEHLSSSITQLPMEEIAKDKQLDSKGGKFVVALLRSFNDALAEPKTLLSKFGLAASGKSYFYTLGLVPVIKVELDSAAAFWKQIDLAEQQSDFTHAANQLNSVNYRRYRVADVNSNMPIDLILSVNNDLLTVTVSGLTGNEDSLKMALQQLKPQVSLADSGVLQDTIKTYDFKSQFVTFFNNIELMKGLTTTDGNTLAKQLTYLFDKLGQNPLLEVRQAECASELQKIAGNWPRIVAGYTHLDVNSKSAEIDTDFVVESHNKPIMTALAKLRGFAPSYVDSKQGGLLSLGLALNNDEIVPAMSDIWNELQTPAYKCAPLAQFQQQLSSQNPIMLGMFTAMTSGVKGIASSLINVDFADGSEGPEFKAVDALVSVSADNPVAIFNNLKTFAPMLANVTLSRHSDPIDLASLLPIPPQLGVKPMMAVKGQHLVIYTQGEAETVADSLTNESITSNGFFKLSMDHSRVTKYMLELAEMTDQPIPNQINMFGGDQGKQDIAIDFIDKGIVLSHKMSLKSDK
ncbi:MAG: hypothetical protein ACPGUD_02180 [Parashewanella sp.]